MTKNYQKLYHLEMLKQGMMKFQIRSLSNSEQ